MPLLVQENSSGRSPQNLVGLAPFSVPSALMILGHLRLLTSTVQPNLDLLAGVDWKEGWNLIDL